MNRLDFKCIPKNRNKTQWMHTQRTKSLLLASSKAKSNSWNRVAFRCSLKIVKWRTCWLYAILCLTISHFGFYSMRTWINWNSQSTVAAIYLSRFSPLSLLRLCENWYVLDIKSLKSDASLVKCSMHHCVRLCPPHFTRLLSLTVVCVWRVLISIWQICLWLSKFLRIELR